MVLKEDLPPGASVGEAYRAVGGYFLAVDVLDSVWEGYRFTLPRWWRTTPPGAASSWEGGASPGFPKEASGPT